MLDGPAPTAHAVGSLTTVGSLAADPDGGQLVFLVRAVFLGEKRLPFTRVLEDPSAHSSRCGTCQPPPPCPPSSHPAALPSPADQVVSAVSRKQDLLQAGFERRRHQTFRFVGPGYPSQRRCLHKTLDFSYVVGIGAYARVHACARWSCSVGCFSRGKGLATHHDSDVTGADVHPEL
jgi:hypothetical protein